jgi:hypothetical protein
MRFGNLFARSIHPETAGLVYYIQELAGDADMPRRSQLDLSRLGLITHYLYLVDVLQQEDDYRFSFWGSRMTILFGNDLHGRRLSDIADLDVRDSVRQTYDHVVETGEPLFMRAEYAWPGGKYVPIERLLLPMATDDGQLGAICGVSVPDIADADLEMYAGYGPARLLNERELMLRAG